MYWYVTVRYCDSPPANLSTVYYDGLQAYNINGSIPIGSIVTAYCNEGYVRRSSTIMVSGKCVASGKLDGDYQECQSKSNSVISVKAYWCFRLLWSMVM